MLDTSGYGAEQIDPDCPPTYAAIQKWIEDNHGVKVSKSSVTMVKDKCGALKLDFKAGKEPDNGRYKDGKRKARIRGIPGVWCSIMSASSGNQDYGLDDGFIIQPCSCYNSVPFERRQKTKSVTANVTQNLKGALAFLNSQPKGRYKL